MMESGGGYYNGYYVPDRNPMYTPKCYNNYTRIHNINERDSWRWSNNATFKVKDFKNPEIARYIHATQNSAVGTSEKSEIHETCLGYIGSEFASRHTQYEMFYAGAQFVTRGHALRTYDWNRSKILVDDILNSYNLEDMFEEKNVAAE